MAGEASINPNAGARTMPVLVPQGPFAGKPDIPLDRPVTTVGSRHTCRLHLLSRSVSMAHALFVNSGGAVYVSDLASRGGVIVNGQAVKTTELKTGDRVQIGKFLFRYRAPEGAVAPVERIEAPAALVERDGDLPVSIDGKTFLIGRRDTSDLALGTDPTVSTAHAVIFQMDGKWYLRDLGSRTGTRLNGKPIHQSPLEFGDRVEIGSNAITFQSGGELPDIAPGSGLDDVAAEDSSSEDSLPVATSSLDIEPETGAEALDDLSIPIEDFDLPAEAGPEEEARKLLATPSPEPPVLEPVTQEAEPAVEEPAVTESDAEDDAAIPIAVDLEDVNLGFKDELPEEAPLPLSDEGDHPKIDKSDIRDEDQHTEVPSESGRMMVDVDLHQQDRLSSSGTHTDLQHEADEALAEAGRDRDESPLAATPADVEATDPDLIPLSDDPPAKPVRPQSPPPLSKVSEKVAEDSDDLLPLEPAPHAGNEFTSRGGWRASAGLEPLSTDETPSPFLPTDQEAEEVEPPVSEGAAEPAPLPIDEIESDAAATEPEPQAADDAVIPVSDLEGLDTDTLTSQDAPADLSLGEVTATPQTSIQDDIAPRNCQRMRLLQRAIRHRPTFARQTVGTASRGVKAVGAGRQPRRKRRGRKRNRPRLNPRRSASLAVRIVQASKFWIRQIPHRNRRWIWKTWMAALKPLPW